MKLSDCYINYDKLKELINKGEKVKLFDLWMDNMVEVFTIEDNLRDSIILLGGSCDKYGKSIISNGYKSLTPRYYKTNPFEHLGKEKGVDNNQIKTKDK